MAKVLREDSDFYKRVQKVFDTMDEEGVNIEYICGEIRISDTRHPDNPNLQDMVLIDQEGHEMQTLAPAFEYKLKVFDS